MSREKHKKEARHELIRWASNTNLWLIHLSSKGDPSMLKEEFNEAVLLLFSLVIRLKLLLNAVCQTHRPCIYMHMDWFCRLVTNVNAFHPTMLNHILNFVSEVRIGLKHLTKQ